MELCIKQLCREKNITMADMAKRIGITPVSLSQSINGNPTLNRLEEIASVLGVEVSDLFASKHSVPNELYGCLYYKGKPTLITSKQDVENLLKQI